MSKIGFCPFLHAETLKKEPSTSYACFSEGRDVLASARDGENSPITDQRALLPSMSLLSLRIMPIHVSEHMLVQVELEAQAHN